MTLFIHQVCEVDQKKCSSKLKVYIKNKMDLIHLYLTHLLYIFLAYFYQNAVKIRSLKIKKTVNTNSIKFKILELKLEFGIETGFCALKFGVSSSGVAI